MDPNIESWSREGFTGETAAVMRPHYTPDYISVEGPHAPHRLDIHKVAAPDRSDPEALPKAIAATRSGARLEPEHVLAVHRPDRVPVEADMAADGVGVAPGALDRIVEEEPVAAG